MNLPQIQLTLTTLLFTFAFHFCSQAQYDTTNLRFYSENQFSNTVTSGVLFGNSINYLNQSNDLFMNIYQPSGDTTAMRPLIIFAHGGGFYTGTRNDSDIVRLCRRFSRMGYVTATIDYRLGAGGLDSVNAAKAILRAVQDMKAAVRFFHKDATTSNTYKINPNYIFIGGSSAGGSMGINYAYWNSPNEFPLGTSVLNQMGGFEGNSGNAGYSTNFNAVVSYCGAAGDTSWIKPGDKPAFLMHGNLDTDVPYNSGYLSVVGINIFSVDGSYPISQKLQQLGIVHDLYTFNGAQHIPYFGNSLINQRYLDTVLWKTRDFLRDLLAKPVGLEKRQRVESKLFPNPATKSVCYNLSRPTDFILSITNLLGEKVFENRYTGQSDCIAIQHLPPGLYFVHFSTPHEQIEMQKLLLTK